MIFFILLFVFAKWGPAINFATTTQTKGDPFIVSGEGKVFVTPNIAKISLGIQDNGPSLKSVQNSVNTKSKSLTDTLKRLGIAESDIKTNSYNVYPQYDYNSATQKITGYQISIDYEVIVKDFDKVNDVVVASTSAGANMIGGITFDLNEATKTEKTNEARAEAVKNAKIKAEGLASAAGITLGKVINVSENQPQNFRPIAFAGKGAVGLSGSTPVQPDIQPGTTEIDVTVSLSYEVR